MDEQEKRTWLQGRPTRYELIAYRGEQRYLIAYCMRKGRHSIMTACRQHGQAIIDRLGIGANELLVFLRPAHLGAHIGPAADPWYIRFSGRTQREAIGSELPWIAAKSEEVKRG